MLKHGIWRRRLLILCVIAALCGQWRPRVALTMNASADAVAVEAIGVHEGGVDSMAVSMEAAPTARSAGKSFFDNESLE